LTFFNEEGFNLECGNLENGDLEGVLASKIVERGISKTFDGFLEINLENGYLENAIGTNIYLRYKPSTDINILVPNKKSVL